uniref:Uncharacterized protein n=1 Tax=Tetranychus urticae TaxID=32264 RepID=T1K304_TETUR
MDPTDLMFGKIDESDSRLIGRFLHLINLVTEIYQQLSDAISRVGVRTGTICVITLIGGF